MHPNSSFAMKMKNTLSLVIALFISSFVFAEKADSVGSKVKNGKVYVLHKVEAGQGLYSISKKYGVALSDLIAENPGSEEVIKIDQILWVPTDREVKMEEAVVEDFFTKTEEYEQLPDEPSPDTARSTWGHHHNVVAGETLFAIARKYNTSVELIKSLNRLDSDMISEGQSLLVPGPGMESSNEEYEMDIEAETTDMDLPKQVEIDEDIPVEEIMEEEVSIEGYSIKVTRLKEYNLEKVEEEGRAEIASNEIAKNKNFAHHFNAPLGTVIMVNNPATNKTVFVKVVGNFNIEDEQSSVIKLSELSASSIGLDSEGGMVSLSYAR